MYRDTSSVDCAPRELTHAKCTCKNGNVYKKGRPCKNGIRKVQK